MIAETISQYPDEIAERYTTDDIAEWAAFFKIRDDETRKAVEKERKKSRTAPKARPASRHAARRGRSR